MGLDGASTSKQAKPNSSTWVKSYTKEHWVKFFAFGEADAAVLEDKGCSPTFLPFMSPTRFKDGELTADGIDQLSYVKYNLKLKIDVGKYPRWSDTNFNFKNFCSSFVALLRSNGADVDIVWKRAILPLVTNKHRNWIEKNIPEFTPWKLVVPQLRRRVSGKAVRFPALREFGSIKPLKSETVFDFVTRYERLFDDMNSELNSKLRRDSMVEAELLIARLPPIFMEQLEPLLFLANKEFANLGEAVGFIQRIPSAKSVTMFAPRKDVSKIKCSKCKNLGHYASNCPSVNNNNNKGAFKDYSGAVSVRPKVDTNNLRSILLWTHSGSAEVIKVPVLLHKSKVVAVLDTGSSGSCMSAELAKKIGLSLQPCVKSLTLADSGIVPINFLVMAEVACGRSIVKSPIYVVDKLHVPLLLGLDLFYKFKFSFSGIPHDFPTFDDEEASFAKDKKATKVAECSYFKNEQERQQFLSTIAASVTKNLNSKSKVCNLREAVIDLPFPEGDAKYIRQYSLPKKYVKFVDCTIKEWLASGVISRAPVNCRYNNPLTTAPKKKLDGTIDPDKRRVCLDPRYINAKLPDDNFTIPLVADIFEKIKGCKIFSTLDLKSAFHRCPIVQKDKEKTAFTWNFVQWMFNVAPFGIKTMSSKFQRVMSLVIDGLDFVVVFVDDLFIFSKDVNMHTTHVCTVLDRLTESGLLINLDKCHFGMKSLNLLGHVVSAEGVSIDARKLANIDEWPRPTTDKTLQSFLGFVNYFRAFIPMISKIAAPLEELRNVKSITDDMWTPSCKESFRLLKELLSASPILSSPDFTLPFFIATDASYAGIGSVLYQIMDGTKIYIAFKARALRPSERNYSVNKLEMLGLVYALNSFRQWIYGNKFTVYTDHQAMVSLFSSKKPNPFLSRWMDTINDYNFDVIHLPGVDNVLPDFLSRIFDQWVPPPKDIISPIVKDDLHCFGSDITDVEKKALLTETHNRGHFGSTALIKGLKERGVAWKGITKDCINFVANCDLCQRYNISTKGFHPLRPIGALLPFDRVAIDLSGPFTRSELNNSYVLVLVDCATRFIVLRAIPDKSETTVASTLYNIFCDFGFPASLQSDKGNEFSNKVLKQMTKLSNTKILTTVAYHQRANGLAERFVQTSTNLIRKYCDEKFTAWDVFIPSIQWFMNLKIASITNTAPFNLMFSRQPLLSVHSPPGTLDVKLLVENAKRMTDVVYPAIKELAKSNQLKQKAIFDATHKISVFKVGDMVRYENPIKSNKLQARYSHLFKISNKNSDGSYTLVDKHGSDLPRHFAPSHLKLSPAKSFPDDTLVYIDSHGNSLDGEDRYLVVDNQENSIWLTKETLEENHPELLRAYEKNHMQKETSYTTRYGRQTTLRRPYQEP